MQPVVKIENLSVDFKVQTFQSHTFKEWVMNIFSGRNAVQVISALKNINLTIYKGESIAFVGHNGSGKSTLLKAIAGVIEIPSAIQVHGRIGPMIELGSGFDPELNGYENIKLACTLMGISKEEIQQKLEFIVEFSELRNFMHIPFKNYSSGMQARLGFACTTAIDPDLLLVDEVLSVGDSNFSRKCLERIHQLQSRGCTIIIVSHDENTVRKFCDRAVVLDEGVLCYDGRVSKAFEIYHELMDQRYLATTVDRHKEQDLLRKRRMQRNDSDPEADARRPVVDVKMSVIQAGCQTFEIDLAQPFSFQFEIKIDEPKRMIGEVVFGIALLKGDLRIGGINSLALQKNIPLAEMIAQPNFTLEFNFQDGLRDLMAGDYDVAFGVHDRSLERTIFIDKIKQISSRNSFKGRNGDEDIIDFAGRNINFCLL
jgi:ABC-type polysaccharide/polyol phosphate transport system ATPase subunit